MKKQILFVSNDTALMGAPMMLLHLIRWINKHTDTGIHLLTKDGGPLLTEFEKLSKTYVWRPNQRSLSLSARTISRIKQITGSSPAYIPYPAGLVNQKIDLIYLNTADTLHLAPMLKARYNCPVIAHVHELSYSINAYFPEAFNRNNVTVINHFIAASNSVRNNLVTNHQLPANSISVINECVDIAAVVKPALSADTVKKELGIKDHFVVGGSGFAGWRKGTDIFLQVAALVNKIQPDNQIRFIWVGQLNNETQAQCNYEIEKLGLNNKVIFTGSKSAPQNYFQVFDLFALTSREDPFPLVCLEAAALQKPIFCFKDSGGIPEIINENNGKTFDYGDINAMAQGIVDAYRQPEKTAGLGKNAAETIRQYDVNIIAPQIMDLIGNLSGH